MLTLILDDKEVTRLNNRFKKNMRRYISGQRKIQMTYWGGDEWQEVNYNKELNYWWGHFIYEDYYWTPMGLIIPEEQSKQSIGLELNFKFDGEGKTRKSTVFAKNEEGDVVIVHNGGIGGGKKGVGKQLFWDHFKEQEDIALVKGKPTRYALIATLDSSTLGEEIKLFAETVQQIKAKVQENNTLDEASSKRNHSYHPEFWGTKEYSVPERVSVNSTHGLVVDQLKKLLEKSGYYPARSKAIDLYAYNAKGNITHIFEVKSSLSKQNIYTAIGQLYLNALHHGKVKRIFVVPEEIPSQIIKDLELLSINVINFAWKGSKIVFNGLEEL